MVILRGSVLLLGLVFLWAGFAFAQDEGQAVAEADDFVVGEPVPVEEIEEEIEEEIGPQMIDYPIVKLRSLDKITARTVTFDAQVGSTLKFGPIFIKVQSCRKASALDEAESAAFLQVWEVTPEQEAQWIFSGWMFASSPGLSAMDHPIYDVWVLDCLSDLPDGVAEANDSALEGDEGVVSEDAVTVKPDGGL